MKVKTRDLSGAALDWAVAKAEGLKVDDTRMVHHVLIDHFGWDDLPIPRYSADWGQGGPIIERADISFRRYYNSASGSHGTCYAKVCRESGQIVRWSKDNSLTGPTPLIASMRCHVANNLGNEVDVPDEIAKLV